VILIGTGSEVQHCLAAQERLEAQGTPTRVVSMPCQEWFYAQPVAYQQEVLPRGVKARVTVEAGIRMSWDRILGDDGEPVSIEHYGASAPAKILFEQFGFTADNVVAKANAALAKVGEITGHKTGN
jgi:transketolase